MTYAGSQVQKNGMGCALLPLAWKRKIERTGTDDSCQPEYEKDFPPSSKDELGEGESLSMLKKSQGAFAPGGKKEKSL
ncbi:hypothetical protein [Halobacillus kuroshimensis]|uniref:hypothetical protein n=1 Tax=Halobacillus kuroshimensis TaxID=302481 RepID=UPI000485D50F|nr:hypothetical protein [Halobacillus kuroshimensis]